MYSWFILIVFLRHANVASCQVCYAKRHHNPGKYRDIYKKRTFEGWDSLSHLKQLIKFISFKKNVHCFHRRQLVSTLAVMTSERNILNHDLLILYLIHVNQNDTSWGYKVLTNSSCFQLEKSLETSRPILTSDAPSLLPQGQRTCVSGLVIISLLGVMILKSLSIKEMGLS